MQVKVSKAMQKAIKDYLKDKEQYKDYRVDYIELTQEQYKKYVDYDIMANEIDYNFNKQLFKVLRVQYPYNYYATDKYITTKDLTRVFKRCKGSYDSFMQELENEIAI